MVHNVYRLYPGKRVCALCTDYTYTRIRVRVYKYTRIHAYTYISAADTPERDQARARRAGSDPWGRLALEEPPPPPPLFGVTASPATRALLVTLVRPPRPSHRFVPARHCPPTAVLTAGNRLRKRP